MKGAHVNICKYFHVFIALLLISCGVYADDISGVWSAVGKIDINDSRKIELSWGEVEFSRNSNDCIAIDLLAKIPIMYIGGQGRYSIVASEKLPDKIEKVTIYFTRGEFNIDCIIHWLTEDSFWIEPVDNISLFVTGESNVYRRLSGPARK